MEQGRRRSDHRPARSRRFASTCPPGLRGFTPLSTKLASGLGGHDRNGGCSSMDADAMKDLVKRLADAMNSRQLDQLDAIMAEDFVRHCEATPGLEVKSRDDFKAFLRAFDEGFPDNVQTMTHVVAGDDLIGVFANYEGTHLGPYGPVPADGQAGQVRLRRRLPGGERQVGRVLDHVGQHDRPRTARPAACELRTRRRSIRRIAHRVEGRVGRHVSSRLARDPSIRRPDRPADGGPADRHVRLRPGWELLGAADGARSHRPRGPPAGGTWRRGARTPSTRRPRPSP